MGRQAKSKSQNTSSGGGPDRKSNKAWKKHPKAFDPVKRRLVTVKP
jgi:hypothetical protein